MSDELYRLLILTGYATLVWAMLITNRTRVRVICCIIVLIIYNLDPLGFN